ncbi:MAG: hypothetical protein HZB68_01730 [Candidatus Aenigmarchaeota archaeon]|nr:hypothetical protein [Candidatus Aenigmarchaeota archaeon]
MRDMDERIESYCKSYERILKEAGREIPVGGIVTENFYVYPLKKDHLLDFKYGKGITSSILNIGISVYRRLYGNAIKRTPYPWEDSICSKLDHLTCKAIDDIGGENAVGFIKTAEEYALLSVFKNDWVNDFRAREVTNMLMTKLEEKIRVEEVMRMYL